MPSKLQLKKLNQTNADNQPPALEMSGTRIRHCMIANRSQASSTLQLEKSNVITSPTHLRTLLLCFRIHCSGVSRTKHRKIRVIMLSVRCRGGLSQAGCRHRTRRWCYAECPQAREWIGGVVQSCLLCSMPSNFVNRYVCELMNSNQMSSCMELLVNNWVREQLRSCTDEAMI